MINFLRGLRNNNKELEELIPYFFMQLNNVARNNTKELEVFDMYRIQHLNHRCNNKELEVVPVYYFYLVYRYVGVVTTQKNR